MPSVEEQIEIIVSTFYPWAKRELIEAEAFAGFIDAELWMTVRNGLDDFLTALYFQRRGETSSAASSLEECRVHLRTVVHAAWSRAASKKIKDLEDILKSFRIRGNVEEARNRFLEATKLLQESRIIYSQDFEKAVEMAKKAALTANEGKPLIRAEEASTWLVIAGAVFGGAVGAVLAGSAGAIVAGFAGALLGLLASK